MHATAITPNLADALAADIGISPAQTHAAINLLDEGASVPFIARYRKEATGGLDDTQLRLLETRLRYRRELEARRTVILNSIAGQGKLDDALRVAILSAESKSRLEDLYLPYKPKRRTRAQLAREAGLEPLADRLLLDPKQSPHGAAAFFVDKEKGINDVKAALEGARAILVERWGENAELVGELRQWLAETGIVRSNVVAGKETEGAKYSDYFAYTEPLKSIPSHRLLALFRARREGIVTLELEPGSDTEAGHHYAEGRVAHYAGIMDQGRAADAWLLDACRLTWRVRLHTHLLLDLFNQAREQAETQAITVFGENLKDLLLAAPAGAKTVMGLDPGIRTGCKVAVVDATGKLLATDTIYPHEPKRQWRQAVTTLKQLCETHNVELIAIGNGTASRETDKLAAEVIKAVNNTTLQKLVVSEAGASVYSASQQAAKEFPELDVTLRGAVSIARRLQDPLAELVKIEPKAIGVGQYQHDVDQFHLARALNARVEDCVNAVGVSLNTASSALLARVSGLSTTVADNIVHYRDQHGPFKQRRELLHVPRLGEKTFEQCAGFLRINDGEEPLDASAVHPESYPVVERIVSAAGCSIQQLIGNSSVLRALNPQDFVDERFGLPTVRDIFSELEKPGRDPRPEFKAARFAEGIEQLADLHEGMIVEGVISNVTAFGAFVDIGVHHDGLVHISALADRFVKDPRDVVKAGDIVKVKIVEVDAARKRIALSMRLHDTPAPSKPKEIKKKEKKKETSPARPPRAHKPSPPIRKSRPEKKINLSPARLGEPAANNALAQAFARAVAK